MSGADAGVPGDLEQRLRVHGFKLVEQWTGGPMGGAKSLFSDGLIDVAAFDDRGEKGVAVGARGGTTFALCVWIEVLGTKSAEPSSVDGQLAWVIERLAEIREVVRKDADIENALTKVNWTFLREGLGLGPDADPDDPSTW